MKCCICEKESFFGLSIFQFRKKICTACKASFIGMLNLEHDLEIPINDSMGFTFFTPSSYIHYPSGRKVTPN